MSLSTKFVLIVGLLLILLIGGSCAPARSFDNSLNSIAEPYSFSILSWESRTIPQEIRKWLSNQKDAPQNEIGIVTDYFSIIGQIEKLEPQVKAIEFGSKQGDASSLKAELSKLEEQKNTLQPSVEQIIARQIKEVVTQEGIYNPLDRILNLKVNLPPVNFKLERLPHLLVISSRDRIESIREITLNGDITPEQIEEIEAEADKLGVSSLVVELGGFGGTYPTLVADESSLRFILNAVAEEWLHQYLAFTPLGFRYVLDRTGLRRDYDIATINETVAGIVSKEIGSLVYKKYYSSSPGDSKSTGGEKPAFDFNGEMREIRRTVDNYLAQGEIEKAEEFMEAKRLYLAQNGYYIRKLNQAYFAFHGTYADHPTSISPIGQEVRELRNRSTTLKDFLDAAAGITSRQELVQILK